jgi:hypothetical protein
MLKNKLPLLSLLLILFLPFFLIIINGCNNEDESDLKQPPKLTHENSVEYYVTTTKDSSHIIITTKKDIYSNYKLLSSTVTNDTLPNIGFETVTKEDSEGNDVKSVVPKAYDIYFKSERK